MSIEVTKIPAVPRWADIVIDSDKEWGWHSILRVVINNVRIHNLQSPEATGDALSLGNPIPAIAGNVLFSANPMTQTTTNHEFTILKETRIWRGGTYRISFDLRSSTNNQSVWAELYRNGTRLGTTRWSNSSSWQTFTEDISGWNAGDLVQVYGRSGGGHRAEVRNLRLYTQISFLAENLL